MVLGTNACTYSIYTYKNVNLWKIYSYSKYIFIAQPVILKNFFRTIILNIFSWVNSFVLLAQDSRWIQNKKNEWCLNVYVYPSNFHHHTSCRLRCNTLAYLHLHRCIWVNIFIFMKAPYRLFMYLEAHELMNTFYRLNCHPLITWVI